MLTLSSRSGTPPAPRRPRLLPPTRQRFRPRDRFSDGGTHGTPRRRPDAVGRFDGAARGLLDERSHVGAESAGGLGGALDRLAGHAAHIAADVAGGLHGVARRRPRPPADRAAPPSSPPICSAAWIVPMIE